MENINGTLKRKSYSTDVSSTTQNKLWKTSISATLTQRIEVQKEDENLPSAWYLYDTSDTDCITLINVRVLICWPRVQQHWQL